MQKLTEKHRFATVDRALRFFRRRARRRPETAGLVTKVNAQRKKIRDAYDAYIEAVDERVAVGAELRYRDAVIDRLVVVGLKRDLQVMLADDHDAAVKEKKLFQGVAPSEGMKPIAGDVVLLLVAGIIGRLKKDADFKPIKDHAPKLEKAQKDVDDVADERKKAVVAERTAQGDLDVALDEARRFYNQLYPQLSLLFPRDAALVESYFLDLRSAAPEAGGGEGGGESDGGKTP